MAEKLRDVLSERAGVGLVDFAYGVGGWALRNRKLLGVAGMVALGLTVSASTGLSPSALPNAEKSAGLFDLLLENPVAVMGIGFAVGFLYGGVSGAVKGFRNIGKEVKNDKGEVVRQLGVGDAANLVVNEAFNEGFEWMAVAAMASLAFGYIRANIVNLISEGVTAFSEGMSVKAFVEANGAQIKQIVGVTILGGAATITVLRQAVATRANIIPTE